MTKRSFLDELAAIDGFTPAPKYATQTAGEAAISETFEKYHAPRETSYDKALRSEDYKKLRDLQQKGDSAGYDAQLEYMQQQYGMMGGDVRRMAREAATGKTSSQHTFQHLDWPEQKRILQKMPPEEREKYIPYTSRAHRGEAEELQ